MALTFTRTGYNPMGAARPIRGGFGADLVMPMGEFVLDSAYNSGGEALAASDAGLADIMFIHFSVEPSAGATNLGQSFLAQYNYDTAKVMVLGSAASTAAANQTLKEIPNNTDLSAFTVRFMAIGHSLT
mgnify:CR=1 FL=1